MNSSNNNTVFFIDLEGTLLNEGEENLCEENLTNFISLIDQVENLTQSKVDIHLVSPIPAYKMQEIKDDIDKNIARYNRRNNKSIKDVASAACDMSTQVQGQRRAIDATIVPLPTGKNRDPQLLGLTEKELYVKYLIDYLKDRDQMGKLVYIGNGRNDIRAMKYVRSQGGIVLCPRNSRTGVREIADYTSNLHALQGVNEALTEAIKNNLQKAQRCYGD